VVHEQKDKKKTISHVSTIPAYLRLQSFTKISIRWHVSKEIL